MKTQIILFVLVLAASSLAQNITQVEYFIDNDPGFGNGVQVNFPPSPNIELNFNINLDLVSDGYHILYIRSRDSNGRWSLNYSQSFLKVANTSPLINIIRLEYFIDFDPGYENAAQIFFTPDTTISTNYIADLTSVSEGYHIFYVRARDANGRWSLNHSQPFFKGRIAIDTTLAIRSIKYFFSKSGINTQEYTFSNFLPTNNIDVNFVIDLSDLKTDSTYYLHISGMDVNGNRSINYVHRFTNASSTTSIRVVQPNGGEIWESGSLREIKWVSSGVQNVKLELTTNNGLNWNLISANVQAADKNYSWTIPNTPSLSSKVRISDISNVNIFDLSDSSFSIISEHPGWSFINTGINHILLLPLTANPNINGSPLSNGDYVGVFYDSSGVLLCAGYSVWTGTGNIVVTAWGDDQTTSGVKEGFANGEVFKWMIWRKSDVKTFRAYATYQSGGLFSNDSTFAVNGLSGLASLVGTTLVNVESNPQSIPNEFALYQNYPNPFNPSTTIKFALPERAKVTLSIYNLLGEKVIELVNGEMDAGYHEIQWNANGFASGVYFYTLQAGTFIETKKLILMK